MVISQSKYLVRSEISSATWLVVTSASSSNKMYMDTLSEEPPSKAAVASPPADAPMVSIPSISEMRSITSSDRSVNSSKVSRSPFFAPTVTVS